MKEYPKYRSPIRLLRDLGLNASDDNLATLKSERTRFLQILDVSANQQVRIGSRSCTKTEVIELFDELDTVINIDFHLQIFENPSLLRLLEEYTISGNNESSYAMRFPSIGERNRFSRFISPYLAYSINQMMTDKIQKANYSELCLLTPIYRMLTPTDGIYAFQKFNEFCQTIDQTFAAASPDITIFPIEDFLYLRYYPFYDFVNEVEIFYPGIVDKVATSVIYFTRRHQANSARKDHISAVSKHLKRLKCSDDILDIIEQNNQLVQSQGLRAYSPNTQKVISITLFVGISLGLLIWYLNSYGLPDFDGNEQEMTSTDEVEKVRPVIDYDSQVDLHRFDFRAFQLFHDSTYRRVVNRDFIKNDFVWDGTPEIRTPLAIIDSMGGRAVGRRAKFVNETPSEIIMIVQDQKSLNSYYAPPKSTIQVALDPNSHVFFYSGNNWNDERTITYRHMNENIMTDGITLRYTGSFDDVTSMDRRLLKKMYYLNFGSAFDMKIEQIDGEYVFTSKNEPVPMIRL